MRLFAANHRKCLAANDLQLVPGVSDPNLIKPNQA
jgi:hypothetical protein